MLNKIKRALKGRFSFLLPLVLLPEYWVDFYRYSKYSGMISRSTVQRQLLGRIIQDYHVIEKGLTMPESRQGFGRDRLSALVRNCLSFIEQFGFQDEQVKHAVKVVNEYWAAHEHMRKDFDSSLQGLIDQLVDTTGVEEQSEQRQTTPTEYFCHQSEPFERFAPTRKSIRNYSDRKVPNELIEKAVQLAISSPSSCNKQGSRVHLYQDPEQIKNILSIQTGNRGFGHLAKQILVVTGDVSFAHNVYERHELYVDGGMFGMSLLYGLHSEGLVACPLNCYLPYSKERKLRAFCEIPDSEMLVMVISFGFAPEEFSVALSHRHSREEILTIH